VKNEHAVIIKEKEYRKDNDDVYNENKNRYFISSIRST
jgi:hypothetical protein